MIRFDRLQTLLDAIEEAPKRFDMADYFGNGANTAQEFEHNPSATADPIGWAILLFGTPGQQSWSVWRVGSDAMDTSVEGTLGLNIEQVGDLVDPCPPSSPEYKPHDGVCAQLRETIERKQWVNYAHTKWYAIDNDLPYPPDEDLNEGLYRPDVVPKCP